MDKTKLRVGVVGVGYWGSKHLRVLQSIGVEVVAIDERIATMPQYAHLVASGHGRPTLDDALPYVDAVVIATPPTSHVGLALEAIAAGKHVLVEKPLATTTADARMLIRAADAAGLVLMVGHTFEYNSAVWMLRDLVQTGELGQLYYLNSARLNLGLYQSDVNVIYDLAPHDISIANHVLGARPSSVEAWGSRHVHESLEDVAYLRLHYDELGVEANIHVSWLDPHKVRRATVVGSNKMAVYDDTAEERIRIHDKAVLTGTEPGDPRLTYRFGSITSPPIKFDEPLSVQDKHFTSCILDGLRPATDGECGLAVVEVLEAAQESMRKGCRIDLVDSSVAAEVFTNA